MTNYKVYLERIQTLHITVNDIPDELTGDDLEDHILEYCDKNVSGWEWDIQSHYFVGLWPQ